MDKKPDGVTLDGNRIVSPGSAEAELMNKLHEKQEKERNAFAKPSLENAPEPTPVTSGDPLKELHRLQEEREKSPWSG